MEKESRYWIIGQIHGEHDEEGFVKWSFVGVFDTEEQAVENAKPYSNYFIGPAKMNELLPQEPSVWEGCYYPYFSEEVSG